MHYRLRSIILSLTLLFFLTNSAWASPSYRSILLQVFVPDASAIDRFASTGLPCYAVMDHFLLVGTPSNGLEKLDAAGLEYRLLDTDMHGAHYYLAYLHPSQVFPAWEDYGQLLLAYDNYALLRSNPEAITRLSAIGIGFQSITLTPKPLPDLGAVGEFFPDVVTPDPFVQQLIDQVTESEIYDLTAGLSGVDPVTVGGEPFTILTRYTYSGEPIQKATQYIGDYLDDLGLMVDYHTWSTGKPPNVIGEIQGLVNPNNIYIIGGHLDDMPDVPPAPGADDNASGSVATLLAAKIFSQYYWGCTLRFALWTGEEQGMLGSKVYAQRSYSTSENILGYLNLDMIAWIGDEEPGIDLHANSNIPATLDLAGLFVDVITAYDVNLIPEIIPNGTRASDHSSFWDYNYVSILGIEDMSDFNDNYHTPDDQLQYLNLPFYTDFVKASLATFAHLSSCRLATGTLEGTVSEEGIGKPIADASLVFTDALGNSFIAQTDAAGNYTTLLPAGVYTVTITATGYLPTTISAVAILADTLVTQNYELSQLSGAWLVFLPFSIKSGD